MKSAIFFIALIISLTITTPFALASAFIPYDHEGQRVMKYEPLRNQTTYYIDKSFIRVINSSGTFDTIYYYDSKDLVARKEVQSNKTFFYHPDHLGSTSLITNSTGQVVEETTYEPFGKVFSGGNDRFLYTGKEKDTGTGLEYYGARYYDPAKASQFISPDSVIPDIYDPQALNAYSYARQNPYTYTDPSGNQAQLVLPSLSTEVIVASILGVIAVYAAASEFIPVLGQAQIGLGLGPATTGGGQPANTGIGTSSGSPDTPADIGNSGNPSAPTTGGPDMPSGPNPNNIGKGGYNTVTQSNDKPQPSQPPQIPKEIEKGSYKYSEGNFEYRVDVGGRPHAGMKDHTAVFEKVTIVKDGTPTTYFVNRGVRAVTEKDIQSILSGVAQKIIKGSR